jgi:ribosome biogenesis GTPase / thiamine phosphate phosphatase
LLDVASRPLSEILLVSATRHQGDPLSTPSNYLPTNELRVLGWKSKNTPVDPENLGRVVRQDRAGWTVSNHHGDLLCELRGRLRSASTLLDRPSVGDWVEIAARPKEQRGTIESVLPRTSALIRNSAGATSEPQVVAANVDVVFITIPSDVSPNPRRVERELVTVWESGAAPVLVLTKSDLGGDRSWVESVSLGSPIVPIAAFDRESIRSLEPWLGAGVSLALLGPSGAGKSTLANALLGAEHLDTGGVRLNDRRGRHTTTRRELIRLPGGALLIDTPGIRELALWDATDGVGASFVEVEELAATCRFTNCSHDGEPGCAVQAGLEDGTLDEGRVKSWDKLQREAAHQARRVDHRLAEADRKKWGKLVKEARTRTRK